MASSDSSQPVDGGVRGVRRRRILRLAVAVGFFFAVLSVLYVHLIVWPQQFSLGQAVPQTVFSPISFDYVDKQREAELSGNASAGNRWIADPEAADKTQAAFNRFTTELRQLRQDLVRWQQAGELEARRSAAEADLGARHGVEPRAVAIMVDLDQQRFEQAIERARNELAAQMSGDVTLELVRELQRDSVASTLRSPHHVYVNFLRANLAEAPPQSTAVDTKALATVSVAKGSIIVAEGQEVDERVRSQLTELRAALAEQSYLRLAATGLLLLLLLAVWGWLMAALSPRVFNSPAELSQQAVLFVLLLVVGIALGRLPLPHSFFAVVLPVSMLATIGALIYDRMLSVYFGLGLAAVLCGALNLGASLSLYVAAGALLPAVLLPAQTQRRTQVLLALGLGVQNVLVALAAVLISALTIHWEIFPIAFGSGLLASVLAFGLLPLVESVSGQVTSGKLVELASPENPLLRRLKQDAHGTWSHSQNVAELTEEACKAIGSNWLLAKVGALYHDIGKLKRPGFFAENIHDPARNPHQGLPPETSARIVRDHVSDGMVLAREARLPRDIWPFIQEHHGTYLIRYFYAAAQREHEQHPLANPAPQRENYCYLGPVPQSRESGVLMLADIFEAVLRTRPEAGQDEMRRVIDGIITDKISEGQLAKSGLTLGDLVEIKNAFVRVLGAQRHQRVLYPGQTPPSSPMHFHSRGQQSSAPADPAGGHGGG